MKPEQSVVIFSPLSTAFAVLLAFVVVFMTSPQIRGGVFQEPGQPPVFLMRGDANDDVAVDVSDAIALLNHLFLAESPPNCEKSGDANDDGAIDISDPVFVLVQQFVAGLPAPSPYGFCGGDVTIDELTCEASSCDAPSPDGIFIVFDNKNECPQEPCEDLDAFDVVVRGEVIKLAAVSVDYLRDTADGLSSVHDEDDRQRFLDIVIGDDSDSVDKRVKGVLQNIVGPGGVSQSMVVLEIDQFQVQPRDLVVSSFTISSWSFPFSGGLDATFRIEINNIGQIGIFEDFNVDVVSGSSTVFSTRVTQTVFANQPIVVSETVHFTDSKIGQTQSFRAVVDVDSEVAEDTTNDLFECTIDPDTCVAETNNDRSLNVEFPGCCEVCLILGRPVRFCYFAPDCVGCVDF